MLHRNCIARVCVLPRAQCRDAVCLQWLLCVAVLAICSACVMLAIRDACCVSRLCCGVVFIWVTLCIVLSRGGDMVSLCVV